MSAIDWSAHTPREVWEALKTAPKVAGPWVESYPGHELSLPHRSTVDGKSIVGWWTGERGFMCVPRDMHRPEGVVVWHATLEEAQAATDKMLREAGWLLVDEDGA